MQAELRLALMASSVAPEAGRHLFNALEWHGREWAWVGGRCYRNRWVAMIVGEGEVAGMN
jgi:hypothetical protein